VQRILSLATLGVLGGLVWMFLSGGGLNQLAQPTDASPSQQQNGGWNGGFADWPAPAQPAQSPPVQPVGAGAGAAAPPVGFGPTIAIASYNIEVFGQKKAGNEAVMATLRAVIRQFHVVAIQEIRTQDDYFIPNFVSYINRAQGAGDNERRFDYIVGPRLGNTTSTEQYAFLWDAERVECSRSSHYTVGDPDNLLHREPLVATFRTRGVHPDEAFTFTLINVHVDPDVPAAELDALAEVYRVVRRAGGNEDDVIMLGDFNADDAHMARLGQIPGIMPLIRGVFTNTRQNKLLDNIIIHQPSTTEYAGRSGVFDLVRRVNLTLDQADAVSDHFPIWAEFSVYERDYAGNVASRRGTVR
jgi:endonuclease/exonuclease/phosphatase family metal-dependent hydrolase